MVGTIPNAARKRAFPIPSSTDPNTTSLWSNCPPRAGQRCRFARLTFDEWYTSCPNFLAGLEALKQRYIGEVRRDFHGWLCDPRNETRAVYRDVETLCRYSRPMMRQPWQRVYLKDSEKGPMVWEVQAAPFWLRREGQVLGPYWLIYARNVLNPTEEKYFLANAQPGTPLEVLLHVAFARWPMERTLEDEKDELGLSHFEVRKYDAIMRHFAVTQVSHLFLARQTQRLRGEKSGDHSVPSPDGRQCLDRRAAAASSIPESASGTDFAEPDRGSKPECSGPSLAHPNPQNSTQPTSNQPCRTPLLRTKIEFKSRCPTNKLVNIGGVTGPSAFAQFNGKVILRTSDGLNAAWQTWDGTNVVNLAAPAASYAPQFTPVTLGGTQYLAYVTDNNDLAIWDGTNAPITIMGSAGSLKPTSLTASSQGLYFCRHNRSGHAGVLAHWSNKRGPDGRVRRRIPQSEQSRLSAIRQYPLVYIRFGRSSGWSADNPRSDNRDCEWTNSTDSERARVNQFDRPANCDWQYAILQRRSARASC